MGQVTESRMRRLRQWMYRDGRPNAFARVANRITALQFASSMAPPHCVTLEVRGRRSAKTISFPLVVADHEGERYLVAMLGEGANWVRNVRAAGGRAVLRSHGAREDVLLTEVAAGQRAPILRRYLELAPGGRAHFPVDQHAPPAELERVAARYPVFRVSGVAARSGT